MALQTSETDVEVCNLQTGQQVLKLQLLDEKTINSGGGGNFHHRGGACLLLRLREAVCP